MNNKSFNGWFGEFAKKTSVLMGRPVAFAVAALVIVVWAISGPVFGYSDTWQLVINTGTTIVTFLMVFLIQNTQNRDTHALQIKIDELIRAVKGAHNAVLDIEELDDDLLERIRARYARLAEASRAELTEAADPAAPDLPEANHKPSSSPA